MLFPAHIARILLALALSWAMGLPLAGVVHADRPGAALQPQPAANPGAVDQQADPDGPWIAEVAWPAVNVHAKPNAGSDVRRVANQGELLRMVGVAPGIDGDTAEWWAATDGYVPPDSVKETANEWAGSWALPSPSEAPHGWWGEVNSEAKVHAGPTLQSPVVGTLAPGARVKVLGEEPDLHDGDPSPWYRIDGGRYAGGRIYSQRVTRLPDPQPNTTAPADIALNHWIVVHRPSSTLTLVKDGQPQLTTYVSLGKAGLETPAGQYGLIAKHLADDMDSATVPSADHAYYMPNVPYTQYFIDDGSAIHGTYWHDLFGTRESQGCINLSWNDAAYLFEQTRPDLAPGEPSAWASGDQRSTILIVD